MRIWNIYNRLGSVILLCGAITAPVHSAGESVDLRAIDIQGDFVQGGLVLGITSAGSTVVYDGQEIRVSGDGQFVIGFQDPVLLKHWKF